MGYDKKKMYNFLSQLKSPRFPATYTDKGFEQALKILEGSKRKNEKDVGQIVLLLTDGIASDRKSAENWVSVTKDIWISLQVDL